MVVQKPRALDEATHDLAVRKLWADPAMNAFRGDFETNLLKRLQGLVVSETGFSLSNLWNIASGSLCAGIMAPARGTNASLPVGWLAILEVPETHSKVLLLEARNRLEASGRAPKKIVIGTHDGFSTAFKTQAPSPRGEASETPVHFAAVDSFLVAGSSVVLIEELIRRRAAASPAGLGTHEVFKADLAGPMRDALISLRLDGSLMLEVLHERLGAGGGAVLSGAGRPLTGLAQKSISALGLDAVQSVTLSARARSNGLTADLFVRVPADRRAGLFKLLAPDRLDALPPAFVPRYATRFTRFRLDGVRAWGIAESALSSISPEVGSVVRLVLDTIGKDQDPAIDFRKQVLDNLGDDFVVYDNSAPPKTTKSLEQFGQVVVVGARDSKALLAGVRALFSIAPNAGDKEALKEWSVGGSPALRYQIMAVEAGSSRGPTNFLYFTAVPGALVVATGETLLQEHLRLRARNETLFSSRPGFAETVSVAGGAGQGFLGVHDLRAGLEPDWERVRSAAAPAVDAPGMASWIEEWFDLKRLPPFSAVSHFFNLSATTASGSAGGIRWRWVVLNPPPSQP